MNLAKLTIIAVIFSPIAKAQSLKINCDRANIAALEQQSANFKNSLASQEDLLKSSESLFSGTLTNAAKSLVERLKNAQVNDPETQTALRNLDSSVTAFINDQGASQRTALINSLNEMAKALNRSSEQLIKDLRPTDSEMKALNQTADSWTQRWAERNAEFARFAKTAGELAVQKLACELKDRVFKK